MSDVTINGRKYNPTTGLPVAPEEEDNVTTNESTVDSLDSHSHHARQLHVSPPRSNTLNRKIVSKPQHEIIKRQQKAHDTTVGLHHEVKRFAPHPVGVLKPKKIMDIKSPVIPHPAVAKAHELSAAKAQGSVKKGPTATDIKNLAIAKAIANAQKQDTPNRQQTKRRAPALISAVVAILLFGGYLTYLNMPALSVRVAAAQAGINAAFPEYRPTGYSLNGPVTFSKGKVTMSFKSNGGSQSFAITQTKSSWNNDAVLDNYVTPRAGTTYIPYTERGLTVYTFDNNAAWVNGGILYTIEGDAPLSSEQVRRIATSLL